MIRFYCSLRVANHVCLTDYSFVAQLFMDAAEYMKSHQNEFDVIVVDASDPVGPAETLYTSGFYKDMYSALRDGGIVCTQGECVWLHLDLIHRVMRDAKALYPVVDYAYTCIPTYPSGQIGFVLVARSNDSELKTNQFYGARADA
jgi:spermidine synthase